MVNIGFLSYWGIPRGRPQVTRCYVNMLKDDHNIFILQEGMNDIVEDHYNIEGIQVTKTSRFQPDANTFVDWIKNNDIDIVVFNEYGQWGAPDENLPELAKKMGCVTLGIIVYERFLPEQAKRYDRIIVSSESGKKLMRNNKVRNFTLVPFSLDLEEYVFSETPSEEFIFLHVGGAGGILERKNTSKVLQAFEKLDDERTRLIITSQDPTRLSKLPRISDSCLDRVTYLGKNLSHPELTSQVSRASVSVLPSKWETIGIPILESLAVGTPVLTVDFPPMNEFVGEGKNGTLCKATPKRYDGISVNAAEVSVEELAKKMKNMVNIRFNTPELYNMLRRNSRVYIENHHDIQKNKKIFIDFINSYGDLQNT